jgi:hypothetical protein
VINVLTAVITAPGDKKMKNFTIENETNNTTVHGSAKEADAVLNSERFGTEATLAKLAANWPAARLVEVYNSLPGETPVKKFKDRATAVSRIWRAIQRLGETAPAAEEPAPAPEMPPVAELPETAFVSERADDTAQPEVDIAERQEPAVATTVTPQTPDVASSEPAAKKKATRTKKAAVAATAEDPGTPREGSKTSQVIAMLKQPGGTTLEEIMTKMGWLKHTTRAMLSAGGSLTKKHGLIVISEKVGDKRVYSIKS